MPLIVYEIILNHSSIVGNPISIFRLYMRYNADCLVIGGCSISLTHAVTNSGSLCLQRSQMKFTKYTYDLDFYNLIWKFWSLYFILRA
jgi:hypothetical protein